MKNKFRNLLCWLSSHITQEEVLPSGDVLVRCRCGKLSYRYCVAASLDSDPHAREDAGEANW